MNYVISIGIDKYNDRNIPDTPNCENDAYSFFDAMNDLPDCGKPFLFIGSDATYESIINTINNMQLHEEDIVYFYYAGHGKTQYSFPHLCCFDSNKEILSDGRKTWLDVEKILGIIAKSKASIIVFLDACHSAVDYSAREIPNKENCKGFNNNFYWVFSSANHDEVARDDKEFAHGIWTHFLLKALYGKDKSALDGDKITNVSLQDYLSKKVANYYKNKPDKTVQTPQNWGKSSGTFEVKP